MTHWKLPQNITVCSHYCISVFVTVRILTIICRVKKPVDLLFTKPQNFQEIDNIVSLT